MEGRKNFKKTSFRDLVWLIPKKTIPESQIPVKAIFSNVPGATLTLITLVHSTERFNIVRCTGKIQSMTLSIICGHLSPVICWRVRRHRTCSINTHWMNAQVLLGKSQIIPVMYWCVQIMHNGVDLWKDALQISYFSC